MSGAVRHETDITKERIQKILSTGANVILRRAASTTFASSISLRPEPWPSDAARRSTFVASPRPPEVTIGQDERIVVGPDAGLCGHLRNCWVLEQPQPCASVSVTLCTRLAVPAEEAALN